eukprot:985038-Alexandrium_andersonii.AAC.1
MTELNAGATQSRDGTDSLSNRSITSCRTRLEQSRKRTLTWSSRPEARNRSIHRSCSMFAACGPWSMSLARRRPAEGDVRH